MAKPDHATASEKSEISIVWGRLIDAQRAEFWVFATTYVKELRNGGSTQKALCNAIYEAERDRTTQKAVKGLPTVTRRMSAVELQRSISRLKERLIEQPEAVPFLWIALQRWTKKSRHKALLAVLDVLGCKRDDDGSLANGESVPHVEPTIASEKISALIGTHAAHDLMLVCNILMLDSSWGYLEQSWERLRSLPENPVVVAGATDSSLKCNERSAVNELSHCDQKDWVIDPEFLDRLKLLINELQGKLLAHASALGSGEFLPRAETLDLWEEVETRFLHATNLLQIKATNINVLCYAVDVLQTSALTLSLINRCRQIVHCTDAIFAGIDLIKSECDKLEQRLQSDARALSEKELKAIGGLIELVEVGESLDDETATKHQGNVQDIFGNVVATAALRSKLKFSATPEVTGTNQDGVREHAATEITSEYRHAPEVTAPPVKEVKSHAQNESLTVKKMAIEEPSEAQLPRIAPESEISKFPGEALLHNKETQRVNEDSFHAANVEENNVKARLDESPEEVAATDLASRTETHKSHEANDPESQGILSQIEAVSYPNFASKFWVNTGGQVQAAPWSKPGFSERVQVEAIKFWSNANFGESVLCARGLSSHNGLSLINIDEVEKAARILENPSNIALANDPQRAQRLLTFESLNNSNQILLDYGLQVILEGISPSEPFTLSSSQIDDVVTFARFNDPAIAAIISFVLKGWAAGINQIAFLQEQSELGSKLDESSLRKSITLAERGLQNLVQKLWSAAGGRIQQTHCRNAWLTFMERHVEPFVRIMMPADKKTPSAKLIRGEFGKLFSEFHKIMATAEVRHKDLKAANDGAEQIAKAIDALSKLLEQKVSLDKRQQSANLVVPLQETERILNELPPPCPDRLYALLLRAVLKGKSQTNVFRIESGVLVRQPDLLRFLAKEAIVSPSFAKQGINPLEFSLPLPATAVLVDMNREDLPHFESDSALLTGIMDAAAGAGRADILAALSPSNVLQAHERTVLHGNALSLGDDAFKAAQQLEHQWAVCNELFSPEDKTIRALVNESKELTASEVGRNSLAEMLLIGAWIRHCSDFAMAAQQRAIEEQLQIARGRSSTIGENVQRLFDAGDYRGGVTLIHGEFGGTESDFGHTRKTVWRNEALLRYLTPKTYLIHDVKHRASEQHHLIREWVEGDRSQPGHLDSIRKAFYAFISGEAGKSAQQNIRRFLVKLGDLREFKESRVVISCNALRAYFSGAKLNPTFLPQLVDFSQIVIFSSDPLSARQTNSVDLWGKALTNEGPGTIGVFLEPGIAESKRKELTSSLRKRGIHAVIIDDVDICRLCDAAVDGEGHNFIPFLELAFEQLDLDKVTPFLSHDGQHVRIETYIGRRTDAEKVALGWTYSRIFSGRKLGKSAFLKFIAHTYNGTKVPSGNTLHVFFITIAGGESESWIVDCIISEMVSRFSLPIGDAKTDQSSAERFSSYMKRFISAKPNENVLLILDEADAFVEKQLLDYDNAREGSLSFRMMKEIPVHTDKNEMPRVRTILSGYRMTNTSGGVWANAGEVLILKPLLEDEAVHFLRGMLSNIGINLGTHAHHIARRCGFQPAVLIRFGNALIRRLKGLKASALREAISVEHDDVVAALQDQSVVSEIRTVVNNNFQSNRVGAAVFGATLLALKDLQPGLALEHGPQRVLSKLIEIDPKVDWLEKFGAPPIAQIEGQLQDFIDRELLTVTDGTRFGVREYRLKFPHFLPVLVQHSEIGVEVRQHIHAARSSAVQPRTSESILSTNTLTMVRHWYQQKDLTSCQFVAIGGQWMDALLNEKSGIPDRLGCEFSSIVHVSDQKSVNILVNPQARIVAGCSTENASQLLKAPAQRPRILIGGLSFLRSMLRQMTDGSEVLLDIAYLGAIPEHTLGWWFEDTRALHFSVVDAIAKIKATTGGIPYFVGEFDKLLPNTAGSDVSEQDLNAAIAEFEAALPIYAQRLLSDDENLALTPREFELLRMIATIGIEVSNEFDLETELETSWEMWVQDNPSPLSAPMSKRDDRMSLDLLAKIGLLSTFAMDPTQLGKVRVETNSVVARMLRSVGKLSVA